MSAGTEVALDCDWINVDGSVCGLTMLFRGDDWRQKAREAGWGWHDHARNRDRRGDLWFCPGHAKVFRTNGGWGYLPSGEAPATKPAARRRWWSR